MSQNIHVLPENLCNKIAAGEVVERPASVVKELLENAIDAGATDILVEVESGGKRLIRIVDNGIGMSQDDAFLALERHATSKVRNEEDLFAVSTLGFRGEALPSIASVSRLRLRTRSEESETGWEIYAEGGSIRKAGEIGAPCGTMIEVRNLFFNTPARRKFMRRDQTEMGHVADVVTRQALACRHIRFRLVHGDRTLIEAHPEESLEARVATILGRPLIREMRRVDERDGADLGLRGLVSQPAQTRSAPSHIYTFINGRYIRDRVVQHAVMEGYRNLLMKGRYPLAVLFIDIDPALVDVNVHPTKQEVRFRDQRLIHDFISSAVRRNLRDSSWLGDRRDENYLPSNGDLTRDE
ncbi:MAG: DNA mismatch repair endonuclease MutL, partial [Desulfuromonadales bacterium]